VAHGVKPVDPGVNVGQVFLGKYRVDSIIGHGGMGVVAECTHLALNERVAIKMLRQDVLLDQDAVQRFVREAQAAVKLKSEYVARVSDVGTFENGVPYMVMEFLEGHDLGQLLEQRGVLPVPWATELMLQTAEALAEAHSLGIVHRDVKPTNLFVTWRPDGTALIKVLDFGISKSPMGTDMQLTQTQSLLGTPAYMSPEQMRSARLVDSRSDIWSLGTVFYEVIEGRRPFEAESFSEMCVKVAVDAPAPMVNAPPALQAVVMKCLAKQPEQRFSTMAELGRELIPFVQDTHQAQLLVDRMTRMLRRAQHTWDGDSTSGASTPRIAGNDRSGAVRVPWDPASDPFLAPMRTPFPGRDKADPSQPFARQDPSEPYASAPSTIMTAQRRRWPLMLFAFMLLVGAGVALGIVASGSSNDDPKPAEQPKVEQVVQPEPPKPEPPKTDTMKAAVTDTQSGGGGSGSAAAEIVPPPAGSDAPTSKQAAATPGTHGPKKSTTTTKPGGATHVLKVVKKDDKSLESPNTGKTVGKPEGTKPEGTKPEGTKPEGTKPETAPECNPFDQAHDCKHPRSN
jgi:eukaryotic-like serine/threonine-protein kinase